MFGTLERIIAVRYLRSRRQEGFISVIAWFSLLGIALGVATLIIVMAVINGYRHDLLTRILGLGGHLTVNAYSAQGLPVFDAIGASIAGVEGVTSVSPVVEGQVLAIAGDRSTGAVVRGVRRDDLLRREILKRSISDQTLTAYEAKRTVLIGVRMATKLGLDPGDRIALVSPKGSASAFGTVPRKKTYIVAGTFAVGMYEYDSAYIYMPFAEAQKFFRVPNAATALEIQIEDPDRAGQFRRTVAEIVGTQARVLDWQRANSGFFEWLQVQKNVLLLIFTLIITVAAFNVISSQVMLVNDKARGIAIMRTMGASQGMMLRIFFMAGSSVGVIGTALGAALGIAFSLNIESFRGILESATGVQLFNPEVYFLEELPARIEPSETVLVVIGAIVISFLASLYPARRAARLDPVEVLRYE